MSKKRDYNHAESAKLENFVRLKKEYRQQLGISSMRLYLALSYLEQKGLGLCEPITATFPELREASYLANDTLGKALGLLNGSLCEVKKGTPIKDGKQATQIRRYSLKELRSGKASKRLKNYTPEHAQQLAKWMNNRTFVYGADSECQPFWNPTRTGRITSGRPPVQNDAEAVRVANLMAGCTEGECLIHLDYRRAEPTVIQHIIGYTFDNDPYDLVQSLLVISEKEAKRQVNLLAYCEYAVRVVKHWPKEAQEVFMPYAEALDSYKSKLWKETRPAGRARRLVETLGDSKVYAETGGKHHRGTIFSWKVQGTVADILGNACSNMIDGEEVEGDWRFCFPVHDSAYVIGRMEHLPTLKRMMEDAAKEVGLELSVRVEMNGKPHKSPE